MNAPLDGNMARISDFERPLADFISNEKFVLKNIRENKAYDKTTKKVLNVVESITYTVAATDTFSNMKVKVLSSMPVITQKELEDSDCPVFVSFPLETTLVRPYSIEYGAVKVSIIAPQVQLVKDSGKQM
ncbi:MAG TPA: hypothetical protein DDY31_13170 [Lachnospiraceae bacterium]|nr:hypothetical protein [Lachnospiraceae bacterium]